MAILPGRVNARTVYLIDAGCYSLFSTMIYTVIAVYYVTVVHFNPLQLVLVGTVLEISEAVHEVPTGVLADTYSRRSLVVLGTFLFGASYVAQGVMPFWSMIIIAEAVRGVGHASVNGALEAWIAGEVGAADVGDLFLRAAQIRQVGALVGIPASVGLASIRLSLPIVLGGGLCLALAAFLALLMPERKLERSGGNRSWAAMGDTLKAAVPVVVRQPIVGLLLAIAAFRGLSSEGIDRLWEAHLLANFAFPPLGLFKPVVWFGVIEIGALVLGIAATGIGRQRLLAMRSPASARTLLVLGLVQTVSGIVFALAWAFPVAVAALWAGALARRLAGPIYAAWLVRAVDARVRATVLSVVGQVDALGQIIGGPVVGAIATGLSLRMGLITSSILLAPALGLYWRTARWMAHDSATR